MPLLREASRNPDPREASIYYQLAKALQSLGRDQEAQSGTAWKIRDCAGRTLDREVESSRSVAGIR